jgi:hypothetical protein
MSESSSTVEAGSSNHAGRRASKETFSMRSRFTYAIFVLLAISAGVFAQLDSDAVMLDKVKIPEIQKSVDLCPVYLEPSDPSLPTWTYKGVTYRGARADAAAKFLKDPDTCAETAKKQRYVNNFIAAMSTIWCPVTDQVTPGGMKQWKRLGVTFESCCGFCDENFKETDFEEGLARLKKRAETAYRLTGGKYTEGARSPVEGAIKQP